MENVTQGIFPLVLKEESTTAAVFSVTLSVSQNSPVSRLGTFMNALIMMHGVICVIYTQDSEEVTCNFTNTWRCSQMPPVLGEMRGIYECPSLYECFQSQNTSVMACALQGVSYNNEL